MSGKRSKMDSLWAYNKASTCSLGSLMGGIILIGPPPPDEDMPRDRRTAMSSGYLTPAGPALLQGLLSRSNKVFARRG